MHVFKIEVRSRWMAAMSLIVGLLAVAVLLIALPAGSSRAADPEVYSGHVVVRFADADTAVRPITWTGTISRVVALQRAGFSVENSGDAVCSINGEGCPSDNCFCPDNLWAQGVWADTAWDSAAWPPPVLVDGDIVAFRMGTQSDYSDWGLAGFLPGAVTFVAASDALEWIRCGWRFGQDIACAWRGGL
jgi:hypothetical protein